MSKLYVQVLSNGSWNHLTTIKVEPGHNPTDTDRKFERAFREVRRQLNGWRGYFGDASLRIAEQTNRGEFREARS